jgi:hypothetical protein
MTTDDLLIDIHYWMEFSDPEGLLDEIINLGSDDRDELRTFAKMVLDCLEKTAEKEMIVKVATTVL